MILGCLHMPLRPTIDWYRWICLICSSRKVGLTPMVSNCVIHGIPTSPVTQTGANRGDKPNIHDTGS